MYPFTRDIHCSLQQSASHCCSLFSYCYILIYHLYNGIGTFEDLIELKLSIVTDRTTGVNADGVYYVSRNVRDTEIIINNKENTLITLPTTKTKFQQK